MGQWANGPLGQWAIGTLGHWDNGKQKIITQSLKSVGQKINYSTNNTTYSKLNNISFEEFAQ